MERLRRLTRDIELLHTKSVSFGCNCLGFITDYDEYLYKIYKTFETQFYYLKEKVFPHYEAPNEELEVEDSLSDTSTEEKEDELDQWKHEVFHYLLFNIDPDQKLLKNELLEHKEYMEFAFNAILKVNIEKVSWSWLMFRIQRNL